MTIAPQLVNNGVQFVTGDLLPAAAQNATISNSSIAALEVTSAMTRPTCWLETCTPVVVNETVVAVNRSMVGSGSDQLFIGISGDVIGNVSVSSPSSFGAILFNQTEAKWYAFSSTYGTAWYKSSSTTMAEMNAASGFEFPEQISVAAAAFTSSSSTDVLVCGSTIGDDGKIVKLTSTSSTVAYSSPGNPLSDIATSPSGGYGVAVSSSHIAYSSNSGSTWTAATYPSIPAHLGHLMVTWSELAGGCFIVSGVTATGQLFWSTSTTGSSWQAWKKTQQVAVPPTANSYLLNCGMCAIGSTTLVAPYVTKQAYGSDIVGALVSIDSGASWTTIAGTGSFPYCTRIRAMKLGNRAIIVSKNGFTATPAILVDSPLAAVSA